MSIIKPFGAALFALGLTLGSGAAMAQGAAHGNVAHGNVALGHGHGEAAMELKLNNGQKWQTDEALRTGMGRMRADLDASLPQIHEGRYGAADYAALGGRLVEHIEYVTQNCKLPEDADLQLHVALTKVLEGVDAMKGAGDPKTGVVAIVEALNAYGRHFDHPGWMAFEHL